MQSLDVRMAPLADLRPYYKNARRGNVTALAESLDQLGQYRPIVVNVGTLTGRPNEILAGNHTAQAAARLGWADVSVSLVDVDEETATRIVLVDNRTNDLATYDDEALWALLTSLPDLDATGFADADLLALGNAVNGAPGAADYLDPVEDAYRQQYAVTVICSGEDEQRVIFERLAGEGLDCRVVTV